MASICDFALKNIKEFVGEEGYGLTASMYLHGKRIGSYADHADGSPEIVSYISDEAEKEMMKLIVSYAKDHPNSYIVDMYLADPKRYEEDCERFKKDYPYIPDDDITVESMSSNSIVYIVEDFLKLKESERLYKQYVKKGYRAISLKGHQVTAYPNNWSDEKIKEESKDQKIFSSLDDFIIA